MKQDIVLVLRFVLDFLVFDYEDEDEDEAGCSFDQMSLNAPAKSPGLSAVQRVIFSGANHPPCSISSGCNWNGPSA
jgi:hypothetical protein